MITNDELKIYICNKYGCDCDECSADMTDMYDVHQCAFDMVDGCLDEYYKNDRKG